MVSEPDKEPKDGRKRERSVLPDDMAGGPHGLGDPNSRRLRKLEKDVIITKIIRQRSEKEKCHDVFMKFLECSRRSGFWVFYQCRTERDVLNECLGKWYRDEELRKECTEQYLQARKKYRETGIGQNMKAKDRSI